MAFRYQEIILEGWFWLYRLWSAARWQGWDLDGLRRRDCSDLSHILFYRVQRFARGVPPGNICSGAGPFTLPASFHDFPNSTFGTPESDQVRLILFTQSKITDHPVFPQR